MTNPQHRVWLRKTSDDIWRNSCDTVRQFNEAPDVRAVWIPLLLSSMFWDRYLAAKVQHYYRDIMGDKKLSKRASKKLYLRDIDELCEQEEKLGLKCGLEQTLPFPMQTAETRAAARKALASR